MTRHLLVACLVFGVIACGSRRPPLPDPPPTLYLEAPTLDTWPAMQAAARTAADSGRFDEADSLLSSYIARRPAGDDGDDAALARALLLIDPRNPERSSAAARDALGALLRRSPEVRHADVAIALRQALVRADSIEQLMAASRDSAQSRNAAQRAESQRLREELANVQAELDRVKRRLSGRP